MRMHLGVPLILSPTYINPRYLPTQTSALTHNEDELIIIIIATCDSQGKENKQMGTSMTSQLLFYL